MFTPLDQFQIISLISFKMFNLDLSITNIFVISTLVLFFFNIIIKFVSKSFFYLEEYSFFIIPNNWQLFIETLYETVLKLLFDNLNQYGEIYFPFISMVFLFILFCNLVGLIPYSFTLTSHLVITFSISFSIFIVNCSESFDVSNEPSKRGLKFILKPVKLSEISI